VVAAGVEGQGAGVVADAVGFDGIEVGEQGGDGGRRVAVYPGAACGDEFDVGAGDGGVVPLTMVTVVEAWTSCEAGWWREGR